MDLITLTDDEARDLLARVYAEVQRRETIANAPAQVERISRAWADASGRQDGDPWTQPVGAHDVWATDAVCQWPVGTYWQATSAGSQSHRCGVPASASASSTSESAGCTPATTASR